MLQWAERSLRGAAFFVLVLPEPPCFSGASPSRGLAGCFTAPPPRCKAALSSGAGIGFAPRGAPPAAPAHSKKSVWARLFWLAPDARALAVKDLRMFCGRTPRNGSQSVMLFGLLGVYIINLRNFTHQMTSPFWDRTLVAFLNLGICSFEPGFGDNAVLSFRKCVFTGRLADVDHRHGSHGSGAGG